MSDLLFIDCSTPEHSNARKQTEDDANLMISSPIVEADVKRLFFKNSYYNEICTFI